MLNVRKFAGNTECCSMYLQWLSPSTDQGYFLGQTIGELCLQRRVYSYIHSEMTYPSGVDSLGESSYFSLVNTREKEEARSCSKNYFEQSVEGGRSEETYSHQHYFNFKMDSYTVWFVFIPKQLFAR